MRISLGEMSDQDLLKNDFESGLEMMRRNMVGAEIWKTGEGVITNGSKEAREAILNIYHTRTPKVDFSKFWRSPLSKQPRHKINQLEVTPRLYLSRCPNHQNWKGRYHL